MADLRFQPPLRLLLVEDDRDSGASLRLMIEKRGALVSWVRTAEEALHEWAGGLFDIIVSDIRLGGMSGVDLLRHIREKSPAFPFILLTGHDSLETAIRAVKLGANDYLLKPLDEIEVLLRPVETAVGHYRLQLHALSVEKELKESERRLSTLMSNLAGVAYRCRNDPAWTMEFVSGGCRDLLGCEPEDLLGNKAVSYEDLIHPDDRGRVRSEVEAALAARVPFRLEYRIRTRNGQERWVWEQGRAVLDSDAVVTELEGFIEDISERKRAEGEIRRLNSELDQRVRERTSQLEAANREVEAFSYAVSHDLRSHLRSIEGFSNLLMQDHGERLGEGGRSDLGRVRAAARKMESLIDALLRLSHLTRRELKREPVDLGRMAADVVADLKAADPKRDVEFVIAQSAAEGDPDMLRVVMQNLLGNACKFTRHQPKARIEFGIPDPSDPAVRVPNSAMGKKIYYVRDNGVGFNMAYAKKLFGAFQRLHSQAEFEGTGIGLATVQRIIHRHGGEIWAESEVAKGATFYFTL
jgi:PAS domain S-box-containing protein